MQLAVAGVAGIISCCGIVIARPRAQYVWNWCMNKYHVWTVGCQMNVSDSERLESALQSVGYAPTEQAEDADFIVMNSCSVRESAEDRVFGKLGSLAHLKKQRPDAKIVLWGCMVGPNNQSIFKDRLPMVDHFVSPSAVDEVIALVPNPIYRSMSRCCRSPTPSIRP